ncbi:MAG: endolytic transglycosylase MltG [Acidimicrobiales bacterium]|nr:endolytic transglycosylase MltG [Acidimicrobiales bacterium]
MTSLHPFDDDLEVYELKPRRSRLKLVLALVGLVLGLAAVLAVVAGWWVLRQVDPPGDPGAEVVVEIPEGYSTQQIASLLEDQGVITDATVFRWYVRSKGAGPFEAGRYSLQERSAMGDVVEALEAGGQFVGVPVTVPEGLTLGQAAARVQEELPRLSAERFLAATTSGQVRSAFQPSEVTSMEGLLFPDTYAVDDGMDETALLQVMVDQLDALATELGYSDAQARVGVSPYEALIVASLIQREAGVPQDAAKIARVIYNRLEQGMPLQIDATVVYALGGTAGSGPNGEVTFEDLEVDSPYNTYENAGLPPTPIALSGRAAMEAALDPAPGPWLFYVVTQPDGTHSFAETYDEHLANIRLAEQNGVR